MYVRTLWTRLDQCTYCYFNSECPSECFGLAQGFDYGICIGCGNAAIADGVGTCLHADDDPTISVGKDWCFPADASVVLSNGSTKKMNELEIGDSVKVGENQFSEVYTFTHRDYDIMARFVQIHLNNGNILELSHYHYLYVNGESNIVPAHLVRAGDILFGGYGQNIAVVKTSVITKQAFQSAHYDWRYHCEWNQDHYLHGISSGFCCTFIAGPRSCTVQYWKIDYLLRVDRLFSSNPLCCALFGAREGHELAMILIYKLVFNKK